MADRLLLLLVSILSATLAWSAVLVSATQAQPARENYDSGPYLYRTFCVSCHGDAGKGDGPVADLSDPRPADLTLLSRNNGGAFPRPHVTAVLDRTAHTSGFKGAGMPDWHRVLKKTESDDERVVRKRLDALVSHIESLQVR